MDYRNYHRDKAYLENESLFKNIFTKRFNIAKRFWDEPGKILDIGTSTGTMLDVFKEHGWETWGVEPSKSGFIAEKKGHKIIHDYFEKSDLKSNFFDMVILNHVLEHLDDPIEVLKKVYKVLKKGGIVFVDVPNFGGLSSKLLGRYWPYLAPEEHKQQFTKDRLKSVFRKSEFKVLHWESRSDIFEFANPFSELWLALTTLKKRFFRYLLVFPFSLLVTILNMGDSISMVGKKE